MENASKALLIAGAILLVIAIIGIGMAIFSQAQNVATQAGQQIDVMAVEAHNRMFEPYMDKIVKGKAIKDLCAKIAPYNIKTDSDYQVTITLIPKEGEGVNLVTESGLDNAAVKTITATKNYLVEGDMNSETGIIEKITVTEQ